MDAGQDVSSKSPGDPRSEQFCADFGRFLIEAGALDELGVQRARRAQRQSGERFDLVLQRLGLLQEGELCKALGGFLGLPLASAAELSDATDLGPHITLAFARSRHVLPLSLSANLVVLATSDPFAADAIDAVSYLHGCPAEVRLATVSDLDRALDGLGQATAPVIPSPEQEAEEINEDDVRRLKDMASEAPIIRLVHDLIARASEMHASDIHIEPGDDGVRVRYRIDGNLRDIERLPLGAKSAVVSRVKIMAGLNIAERRRPQDGRIKTNVRGSEIDLRVSAVPTLKGESVVLRILDRTSLPLEFAALGFGGEKLRTLETLLAQPNGIILVTGPTGSGKTTTLYTALNKLNHPNRKIFTIEDPVEYQIGGISQIQVQPKIGLTFASALRSILRQDPDVMMVGEIRDLETAQMAIQSALTGHLVLSTVHTNSAAATVTRLIQMGVEDYLLSSTLKGILAQRLVRRLCMSCSADDSGARTALLKIAERYDAIAASPVARAPRPRKPVGCADCGGTGYAGRTTIAELLVMSDEVKSAVLSNGREQEIEAVAGRQGMTSMFADGLLKVLAGETTLEEVLRATRAD